MVHLFLAQVVTHLIQSKLTIFLVKRVVRFNVKVTLKHVKRMIFFGLLYLSIFLNQD